jgi:hypothetical protein
MALLYGEGSNAFHRLQQEIIKTSGDQSIFAYQFSEHIIDSFSFDQLKFNFSRPFASDPDAFEHSSGILPAKPLGAMHHSRRPTWDFK